MINKKLDENICMYKNCQNLRMKTSQVCIDHYKQISEELYQDLKGDGNGLLKNNNGE